MEGNGSEGKNTNKHTEINEMEAEGRRRDLEEESRKKGDKGSEVPPQTRHKSKGAVKTQHLRALCFQLSRRGAKTALSRRERESLMSLDVLIAPLITCCCARVTLKSQINHRVNINHAALGSRAGKSFKGRREGRGEENIKERIHTHGRTNRSATEMSFTF